MRTKRNMLWTLLLMAVLVVPAFVACSRSEPPVPVAKAPSRAFMMGKGDACTKHLSYQECVTVAARHGIPITMGTGRSARVITPEEARRVESLTTRFKVTTAFVPGDYIDPDEGKFIPSVLRTSGGEKAQSKQKKSGKRT